MSTEVVARRKGNRYRTMNTETGRMSGWLRIPEAPESFVEGYAGGGMSRFTVPELRHIASADGLSISSKARKSEILRALAVASWRDYYGIGAAK